jgi:hypothetical protein
MIPCVIRVKIQTKGIKLNTLNKTILFSIIVLGITFLPKLMPSSNRAMVSIMKQRDNKIDEIEKEIDILKTNLESDAEEAINKQNLIAVVKITQLEIEIQKLNTENQFALLETREGGFFTNSTLFAFIAITFVMTTKIYNKVNVTDNG